MLKRYKYVQQVDQRDCGVAALATIAKNYGSDFSLAHLRELAKTDMEGTTALGIVRAAELLNFETRALQADMTLFEMTDIPYPFIAHVTKDGKYLHYYVVYGVKKDKLIIADPDPDVGLTKMSKEKFAAEWSGVAIFVAPSPNYQAEKDEKNGLLSFIPLLTKQRGLIFNIVIASLLVTAINIAGSYYLQSIIDDYVPNQMKSTLGIISLGLIITYILQQILSYAQTYLLNIFGQRLSIDVILSYIRHIFELPMSFFATRRTGEILSRFNDANSIIDALASTILSIFLDVSIVVIVGVFLFVQNTTLFLLTLISIPIYALIVILFIKPFQKMNAQVMQSNSLLNSAIIEDVNGIETLKSLTSEATSYQKIDREFISYLKFSFKRERYEAIQTALKQSLKLILNVVILYFGARLVMSDKISLGQLITYNTLLSYFTTPLENIINLQTKIQQAKVANNRLNEVYLVESEFQDESFVAELDKIDSISFDDVSYKYGFGRDTLKEIGLEIKAGEKLALIGASGSGKTTLAKLIVNFFEASHGVVKINNQDIKSIDKKTLRQKINYVPQQPYIFTGSIMENLTLGAKKDLTAQDIMAACELAEIRADIEGMPMNYNTEITDGTGISGGQKQRIALARAILTDSDVLILDEATSSLDVFTEKKVIDNLLKLDKTIIFVAHRLSIAAKSDRIILLEQGQIMEAGSHEELLALGGQYQEMVAL
ncbi:bacteriocin cleavage/export ABC transporter [Lactococcus hodotermopsidis]|uniref:Bacteriocin cleavage/export ABC transporter n=1 Tax=Pseudolactococcus hodotermopsidis TaxID=2709157 RepID=A0A6A0BDJ9_9LACT|nr:peptide cleavage/export ABC transporter [Lactococcus hodotermopsidis]GFH42554.1 bacteriocin cleavage/export ABC transporter [Lactococcus hodotermopsidis]